MAGRLCEAALLLSTLATAAVCPTFSCSSTIPDDICGTRLSSQAFQVNANGCGGGKGCSAVTFRAWTQYQDSMTFDCTVIFDTYQVQQNWTAQQCYVQEYEKEFKANTTTHYCYSDSDCELADGTYSACACTFRKDGMGVCKADHSNQYLFSGYWTECRQNFNHLIDQHAYLYWNFLLENWIWTQSDLECNNVFWEVAKLTALQDKYEGATQVAVGLLLFVAALY